MPHFEHKSSHTICVILNTNLHIQYVSFPTQIFLYNVSYSEHKSSYTYVCHSEHKCLHTMCVILNTDVYTRCVSFRRLTEYARISPTPHTYVQQNFRFSMPVGISMPIDGQAQHIYRYIYAHRQIGIAHRQIGISIDRQVYLCPRSRFTQK